MSWEGLFLPELVQVDVGRIKVELILLALSSLTVSLAGLTIRA
jgi:hypothetical protein